MQSKYSEGSLMADDNGIRIPGTAPPLVPVRPLRPVDKKRPANDNKKKKDEKKKGSNKDGKGEKDDNRIDIMA